MAYAQVEVIESIVQRRSELRLDLEFNITLFPCKGPSTVEMEALHTFALLDMDFLSRSSADGFQYPQFR